MNRRFRHTLSAAALAAFVPTMASANIDIVFDYTYDTGSFFGTAQQSLLEAAALVFESRITDSLGAITSDASLTFNQRFFDPSDVGSLITLPAASVAANVIQIFVGADVLGGSTLGVGGPGGFTASGVNFAAIERGQVGYTVDGNDGNDTDFGPWGGAISFSSNATWYFDTDVTTTESFTGNDFYSVAVHEIAHVLGFGTANSWENLILGTDFVGANSGTVALSGDQGHWDEATLSSIDGVGAFETMMDPSITTGTRKFMTDLDWNGMRDIGWEVSVSPVPEASTSLMLLAGLAGLGLLRSRRQGSARH